jgi:hypothetical protein
MVMESKDIKREKYIPGETPIPYDRHANDYINFDDELYLLGDVRDLKWNEESLLPGHASNIYLFHKPTNQPKEDNGGGFKFVAFSFVGGNEERYPESVELEVIAQGYGYFDGIRSLNLGEPKTNGYIYYPDFGVLSRLMARLHELQKTYCRDIDDRK